MSFLIKYGISTTITRGHECGSEGFSMDRLAPTESGNHQYIPDLKGHNRILDLKPDTLTISHTVLRAEKDRHTFSDFDPVHNARYDQPFLENSSIRYSTSVWSNVRHLVGTSGPSPIHMPLRGQLVYESDHGVRTCDDHLSPHVVHVPR